MGSRTEKSPEDLGADFAWDFQKLSINPIIKEALNSLEKKKRSWRFRTGIEETSDEAVAKEWILLEIFLFGQAILEYFKGNNIGKRIVWSFHEALSTDMVDNIFYSLEEFEGLLGQRYKYYLGVLKESEPNDSPLLYKRILEKISGGEYNPFYLLSIQRYYFTKTFAYEKLVREVINEVHLVT